MKRRSFIGGSAALLASAQLLGLRSALAQQAQPKRGGVIRVALEAQPNTIDPHMTTADATAQIARNVFEQLLALNGRYEYAPMLAESFSQSDDGLVYTFKLRRGVKFHNGKPMTAEDVIASLNKWLATSSKKGMFEGYALAAPDDHTVVLTMARKVYGVLEALADNGQFAGIMPKEIAEAAGPTGVSDYVGTGPFRFVEWAQDRFVRLARNDDYASVDAAPDGLAGSKTVHADELVYNFVSDAATRLAGIMTGEYDVADNLPIDFFEQVRANAELDILQRATNLVAIYNKKEGICADPLIRQAVNAVVDAEAIMLATQSFPEFYRLNSSYMYLEQGNWYSEAGKEKYGQNSPDTCKALLQQAGYKGKPVRILTSRNHAHLFNSSMVLHELLVKAGVNARLDVYDWPTVLDLRVKPAEWDITITGFPLVLAPTQLVYLSSGFAGWTSDPRIDDYVARIHASGSLDEAKALWQELQAYCWEYLPVSKLGDRIGYSVYARRLAGIGMVEGPVYWNAGFAA